MTYTSVWDAIETPEEAEHMKARSEVLIAINEQIRKLGLNPTEAAKRLRAKRSRVYELQAGKVDLFSLDKLVDYAALLGIRVQMQILPASSAH